ncbi:hypothetical protein ACT5AJ_001601 [Cronobacter sakazakii]
MTDTAKLKAAAEKARWGDWSAYKPHSGARGYEVRVGSEAVAQHCLKDDAAFIAEASPKTVLCLIEALEAALAAAQQPVWDGEGLPPVSYECEAKYRDAANAEWFIFRCVGVDCGVAFGWAGKEAVTLDRDSYEFRPIRPEADTKRAAGVTALAKAGGAVDFEYGRKTIDGELSAPGWYELYDKIAAGEVAGIRIE